MSDVMLLVVDLVNRHQMIAHDGLASVACDSRTARVLMGVAGLVGSVFSYQIVEHDKECTKDTQDKNMAIGGMVLSICLILFGGYKFFEFNPTYFARPIPPITQGTSINNAR